MKKIYFVFVVSISLICPSADAQHFEVEGKTYSEIKKQMEIHFDSIGRGKGSGYKQYLRAKTIMDGRINDYDNIQNFSQVNNKAYKSLKNRQTMNRSHHGHWTNVGPFDYTDFDIFSGNSIGRVSCAAFHPTDPQIMWVGTPAGGLWKSIDGGTNWIPLTDGFCSIGITEIAINYNNPNIMYILTGEGRGSTLHTYSIGLLKTTNGGVTWSTTDFTFQPSQLKRGYRLKIHPMNPNILFIGMRGDGLWMTTDGGDNFDFVPTLTANNIWDIEFKPDDPTRMLAATENGLFRSNDSGNTWFPDFDVSFPSSFSCMNIAVCPSAPNVVYAVFNGNTQVNGTFKGCYRSTNFGGVFVPQATTPNIHGWAIDGGDSDDLGTRDLGIIVDPQNEDRIFTGGVNIWRSDNKGVHWSRETYWLRTNHPFIHADQENLYWHNGELYVTNDGGIYKTADYGDNWTDLTKGLAITQFYDIDTYNGSYMGGTQDNGTLGNALTSTSANGIWGADGFGCIWHPQNTSITFLSTQNNLIRKQGGTHYDIWSPGGIQPLWETELFMHPENPGYLFADWNNMLYRGNQNGAPAFWNWDDLGTGPFLSGDIRGYAHGTSDLNTMYVITTGQIIKSSNLSNTNPTWTPMTHPAVGVTGLYHITVDPADADRVWVVCNGYVDTVKVFVSVDGAVSWENISDGLANVPMRCIVYDTSTVGKGLYVGTEVGVYYRGENMGDWVPFANHLPNTVVTDIEIEGSEVIAATFGRGIWKSDKFSSCPPTLILTNANDPTINQTGTQFHSAGQNILSSRSYLGNPGTEVIYKSGNRTDLILGFEMKAGGFFEGKIGDCLN